MTMNPTNQMTRSVDSSKRSENHEPEVNLDPNRSHLIRRIHRHQTHHQRKIKARRRKSVVSIGKMTHPTHLRAMIMIRPMTVIIYVNNAKIRNIGKRIRSDYAQL